MHRVIFFIALTLSSLTTPNIVNGLEEKSSELMIARLILHESQKVDAPYVVRYHEKPFVVYPRVFSPKFFPDTYFFADSLEIIPGESFLEIGSGTGLISIMAALRGARQVTAIDINPEAVKNTTDNVFRHELNQQFKIYLGDLFDPIPPNTRFDTIFWFAPFMHTDQSRASLTDLDKAIIDPDYRGLQRYLQEGKEFLEPNGRFLLGFSSSHGDLDVLEDLAEKNGWEIQLLAQEDGHIPLFPGIQGPEAFTMMLIQLMPKYSDESFYEEPLLLKRIGEKPLFPLKY